MHITLLPILVGLLLTATAGASEKQVVDLTISGVSVGQRLFFKTDKGEQFSVEMINKLRSMTRGRGDKIIVKNIDGNTLSSGERQFKPHSGYRPPGAAGALRVGESWTHRYVIDGVNRTRICSVARQEDLENSSIVVKGTFIVECTNQRADRSLPKHEEIWFAPNLFIELRYEATWGGSSPGSFWYEVVRVE